MKPSKISASVNQLADAAIAVLWYRFRDIESAGNIDLHIQYCEKIQEAMCLNLPDEAFQLLIEGFQWYRSMNEA